MDTITNSKLECDCVSLNHEESRDVKLNLDSILSHLPDKTNNRGNRRTDSLMRFFKKDNCSQNDEKKLGSNSPETNVISKTGSLKRIRSFFEFWKNNRTSEATTN